MKAWDIEPRKISVQFSYFISHNLKYKAKSKSYIRYVYTSFSNILSINPVKEESLVAVLMIAPPPPPPPPPRISKDYVEVKRQKNLCNHSNYKTDFAMLESYFCSNGNKKWVRMFGMKFEI